MCFTEKLNKHHKEILLKYNKHYESDDNDSLFGDQSSDHESDTDSPPLASSKKVKVLLLVKTVSNIHNSAKEIDCLFQNQSS